MFLRVTPVTGVSQDSKSQKLTMCFVCSYKILHKIGSVAYPISLPQPLVNLYDVFHVSRLRRYISDPLHVIQMDNVHV